MRTAGPPVSTWKNRSPRLASTLRLVLDAKPPVESSGHGFYQPAQNPSTYKYRDLTPLGRRANSIAHRNGSATTTNVLRNTKGQVDMDSEGSFGTEIRSIDPIGRLDESDKHEFALGSVSL